MAFLGCGGALFGLFVGLLVGSTLVRAAVAFANRILGPVEPPDTFGQWDDWDSDEPAPKPRKISKRAIPEPGLATGMLVMFLAGIANAFGYGVCAAFMEVVDSEGDNTVLAAIALLSVVLPAGFAVFALILKLLLPTTFGRALLVAFLHYLLVLLVVLVAGTAVYLASSAAAP